MKTMKIAATGILALGFFLALFLVVVVSTASAQNGVIDGSVSGTIIGNDPANQTVISSVLSASPTSGPVPLFVSFIYLIAGSVVSESAHQINFGDGTTGSVSIGCGVIDSVSVSAPSAGACPRALTASHTYTAVGTYKAQLIKNGAIVGSTTIVVTAEVQTPSPMNSGALRNVGTTIGGETNVDNSTVVKLSDVLDGSETPVPTPPEAVETSADLSGYIASQITNDTNISMVETSPEKVAVTYKQTGKLFGIVSIPIYATAVVDAGKKVNVKYPWYKFFIRVNNRGDLETRIQNSVDIVIDANTSANADNHAFSLETQARLMTAMQAALAD